MMTPNLWNQILVWPILNILVAFYKVFEFLHIPGPLGFAIILMTVAIRIVLYPLMHAQLKSARKMQKLKPHLDALAAKHKNDKQALSQAQMALYKEHGVNPAAGCLPLLIQMPVLIALYSVFNQVLSTNLVSVVKEINQVLYSPLLKLGSIDPTFLGVNLGINPGQWKTHGLWLLLIPLITAALQWYQSKLMVPTSPSVALVPEDETNGKKKTDEKKPEDTAMEMQKQMMLITPLMFGFFAFQFPLGLSLYWNIFSVFGIIQQLQVNKQT